MSIDNEFILQDRIQKIQQIVNKYGEENFCISYSGGKDSNVLSELFDLALPNNKIPRVYCNTGIEYKMIVDFVKGKVANDDRFHIITPNINIKTMLEEKGYPFKSKKHSSNYTVFKRNGIQCKTVQRYLQLDPKELDVLQQYFPNERKQCEIIWKPVYEEYRKVGFRLSKNKKENV